MHGFDTPDHVPAAVQVAVGEPEYPDAHEPVTVVKLGEETKEAVPIVAALQ